MLPTLWEEWWLNGSAPDCCPTVPGLNPAPPQPTADCQSPGGLLPWMALGCGLSSVRDNRGENNENEPLVHQKQIKKKKMFKLHLFLTEHIIIISCKRSFSNKMFFKAVFQ
jgi:hypothetical protein